MDCGVPFCHCHGCPVFNLIPEWNDLAYRGKWKEALERLLATNTLPEITGRVCPAPCETSCTLSINDAPVAIKQIELTIIENAFEQGWIMPIQPEVEIDRRIAIVGSGPAGLAAAIRLRAKGYRVTVFEKSSKIGGILRYGIPDFKLEKWVLDRRIKLMMESGIEFETDVDFGEDISVAYSKRSADSLLITVGAGEPRDLPVPGRDLGGIHFAMEFLTQSNKRVYGEADDSHAVTANGKNVLVIGGGDTGSDCIGTANRQGAKSVAQFEIMPKPPEWNETRNPQWPQWPTILRTTSSHEEGVDRQWAVATKDFTGKDGSVQEAHFVRVEWIRNEKTGRMEMREVPSSDFTLKVDLVLLAMGFVHVENSRLIRDLNLELDTRGNIKTDNYRTSVDNVYAAGDAGTGASLVVRAIYHGQKAAEAIAADESNQPRQP